MRATLWKCGNAVPLGRASAATAVDEARTCFGQLVPVLEDSTAGDISPQSTVNVFPHLALVPLSREEGVSSLARLKGHD